MKKMLLTLTAFLGMATASYSGGVTFKDVTFEAVEGSDWGNNEGSDKVCDGDTGTKWCKNGNSTESASYVIIKASESIYIQGFVMTTANDNESNAGRTPKEYKIYGSDAQDGTYELIYHQTDDNYIGDKNYTDYTIYCNSKKKYQYFKLHVISSNLSGSTLFQISEFKLIPATVGFTYKEGSKNAYDGTTGAKWESNPTTSVTLEASEATYLTGYQFTTANDNKSFVGRNPSDWTIEGSDDNSTWTTIVSESGNTVMQNVNYTPYYFSLSNPPSKAYKYFKVTVTKAQGNSYFQMGEVALIGTSTEHKWEETTLVEPTCTSVGYKGYNCSDCGATKLGDEIPMIPHAAYEDGLCKECGYPEAGWMTANDGWYEPTTTAHFNWLAANVKKNVNPAVKMRLTQDVDLTGFAGFGNGEDAVPFKGELDGQGHWLKNLAINASVKCTGLFGKAEDAKIYDLGLTGCNVKTSAQNCGVLAGNMKNVVVNRVAVMDSYAESPDHVGAIVGNTEGSTVISNCLSNAEICSTDNQAGGFVGTTCGLTLTKCLFTGTVKDTNKTACGLVALQDSEASPTVFSYNISAATVVESQQGGNDRVFPIMNPGGEGRTSTYTNNRIAASMTLKYNGGTKENSFDDINGSNGKTTPDADMKVKSFYTEDMGWDMENDWKFVATGEYPVLAWMPAESSQEISITAAGYATVTSSKSLDFSSVEGMTAYAAQVKGSYVSLVPLTDVQANVAFVVEGKEGAYTVPFAVEKLTDMPDNDLKVSDGTVTGGSTVFVLADKSKGVGFYPTSTDLTIPENKGYLQVESSEARVFLGLGNDSETGINNVADGTSHESVIYNMAGQRVQKLQKGVNIVDGKKIMY